MILLDTNVVLDLLQKRDPFYPDVEKIMLRGQNKEIKCYISANSLTDIFYLYAKHTNIQEARRAIKYLLANFDIAAIDEESCKSAMKLPIADFEDALIVQCALKYKVDYIITRDKELHNNTIVKAIPPHEYLSIA
ncbi:MAG: PIN domain-containing protein [Ruminococcus sp.]|jgi:predicted nucleic acid-binding protein|nr:PIN domain-containing protein [Ruminococcus sp.]